MTDPTYEFTTAIEKNLQHKYTPPPIILKEQRSVDTRSKRALYNNNLDSR